MTSDLLKRDILITGATGFIGANLAMRLNALGSGSLHVLIRKTSNPWRIKSIMSDLKVHRGDLRHLNSLKRIIGKVKPGVIFHCATYGGYGFQNDRKTIIDTNYSGLANLIEALSERSYYSFINVGSSSEYGLKTSSMKETDALEPINVYGVSKAQATIYAYQYALRNNKPLTTVRPFSVYGPYEEMTRLVPSLIRAGMDEKTMEINCPDAVRDYIYIDDVVDFLIDIGKKGRNFGVLNLGSGRQRKVLEVIRTVEKAMRKKLKYRIGRSKRNAYDPNPWVADMRKARRVLNWRLKTPFLTGIKKTIEWADRCGPFREMF